MVKIEKGIYVVIFVQPLFAPDHIRMLRNLASLRSIVDQLGGTIPSESFIFGGWAASDALWGQLQHLIEGSLPGATVHRYDENRGKAWVVNELITHALKAGKSFDYILTADSDMKFPNGQPAVMKRLLRAAHKLQKNSNKPLGLLALSQCGDDRNWSVVYENCFRYYCRFRKELICFPNRPSGIAGGCLLIGRKAWEAVGGYRVMGVYSGDDAYLLLDVAEAGFCYGLIKTLEVEHPPEADHEYLEWKEAQLVNCRESAGRECDDLNAATKAAEAFWERRW